MASAEQAPDHPKSIETDEFPKGEPEILPPPAPITGLNGSVIAWVQCAGAFFLFFNCWGVVNTFGMHWPSVICCGRFKLFSRHLPNLLRGDSAANSVVIWYFLDRFHSSMPAYTRVLGHRAHVWCRLSQVARDHRQLFGRFRDDDDQSVHEFLAGCACPGLHYRVWQCLPLRTLYHAPADIFHKA